MSENLVRDVNMACRSRGVLACHGCLGACRLVWVYFLCGLPRGSRGVPVSAAWLRASFGWQFPFLFGRAFIEAAHGGDQQQHHEGFPFLFGRAFIEAFIYLDEIAGGHDFPSFLEGLSLRLCGTIPNSTLGDEISLPFWKGFH